MDKPKFNLSDFNLEAKVKALSIAQIQNLEELTEALTQAKPLFVKPALKETVWLEFVLPLIEFDLSSSQILRMMKKIPKDYSLDHRQIYFDFRLDRWIKHIEPPSIAENLEEYLENSETVEQGMAYLRGEWQEFLNRHSPLKG